MADQVKVTITAQDQTKAGIKSAEANLEHLGQTAEQLQGKAVAAFAALSVAIGGTVKISMDFEAAMDRVAAISQATGSEFETLKTTALAMGADTVYSATQAAGALTSLAQAGFDTGQQVAAIPGVLNMAAVEMMDLGQAADIGSSILAGFNLKAAEMGRVADILTAASVSTNVGITDLGESMKFLGPISSSLGMSLEQTVSAVGLLGNAGIKGGEAGRQLRGGLTALINPGAEAASVIKALGISVADQHGQFRGLTDILGQFQKATAGMSETQRAATVATVVGQESMSTFLALMQAGPDAISGLTKELQNSGGAAERMATQQLDNLKGSLEQMKGQFEDAAIAVGDDFNPNAEAAVAIITDLLTAISGVARDSPGAVSGLGTLALTVSAATIAVTQLYRAFLALQAGMGPAGWIMMGIGVIVGALADLVITTKAAQIQQEKQAATLITLSGRYDELTRAMDDAGASDEQRTKATNDQKKAIEEIGAAFPELVKRWDEHGKAVELDTQRLKDNTQAALDNKRAKGQTELIDLQGDVTKTYGDLEAVRDQIERSKVNIRRGLEAELRGGTINQEQFDQALAINLEKIEAAWASRLQAETQAYNRAVAKVGQKQAELTGPNLGDFIDQEIKIYDPAPKKPVTTPGKVPGVGAGEKMSDALKADLELLQDLQALEHSPENTARILAKTREIIAAHYSELAKLDKLRDMQRTAQITLPNEIAQAEYNAALSLLDSDKALKNLSPEQFAEGLRGIKDRFQEYLTAHPDQALQMDLRLRGASDEELKAPLDRWREAMRKAESAQEFDGTGGLDRKLLLLRNGLSLALGAGDKSAVAELTGQIRQLEKTLSAANFAERFDRIKKAKDAAFAGAAGELAQLQMQLDDEQAKGDKADPQRIAALKQRVLDAVRPALEAQQAALEALKAAVATDTTLSEEERAKRVAEIEAALNGVRSDLYAQDVDAHRIATEAKAAAEKASAAEREKVEKALTERRKALQKDAIDALAAAENAALEKFKAGAKEREDAIQRQIDAKDKQLKQLDRQIATEDRLRKIQELRDNVDFLKAHGQKEEVFLGEGKGTEWRTVGLKEAEKALADAEREDKRDLERQALQDQIQTLRDQLQAERDNNREREDEIKSHFAQAKTALEEGFKEMETAQGAALDAMQKALAKKLDGVLGEWRTYAAEAKRIIESIPTAPDAPAAGAPTTSPSTPPTGGGGAGATPDEYRAPGGGKHRAFATGAYLPGGNPFMALVNDVEEWYTPARHVPSLARAITQQLNWVPPTLPAGLPGGAGAQGMSGNVTIQHMTLSLPNVTDAQRFAQELPGALRGVFTQEGLDAFRNAAIQRQIGGIRQS